MKKILVVTLFLIFINTITFASVDIPEYIKIKIADGSILKLDLEEYLYGVVQSEIGLNYKSVEMEKSAPVPMEALKAQAIASRTYAVYNILAKGEDAQYHLTNTTSSQVYKNINADEKVKKAVDETCGQIALYDGKPANTFFYSTSGGHTESSENVWTAQIPYLRGVKDKYEINVKNQSTWTATYTKDDLAKLFPTLGTIKNIKITDYSENERAIELEIDGTNGTKKLIKNNMRIVMGTNKLRSQWFEITQDGTNFIFTGRGFGHGVGMSQNGAIGMALEGYTYDEIIEWYYTGVKIQGLEEYTYKKEDEKVIEEDEEKMKPLLKQITTICTTNWLLEYIK